MSESKSVTMIQPAGKFDGIGLRELWAYRELLFFLIWRDIKVRYKQTLLGVLWVVLQPIVTAVIFSIIFGNFARMPSDDLPYAVFAMAGLTPWNFFSTALTRGTGSLVGSANLISKVYFPRIIIPAAGILAGLVDFGVVLGSLLVVMLVFGVFPTATIVALPFITILIIALAFGVSLWLSALNVQYRDVGYLTPVVMQIWLYATPVIYSSTLIPEQWRWLYSLNPMTGLLDGFRWALFGRGLPPIAALTFSFFVTLIILISGAFFFRRIEETFADVV
jgi:lipopolysaccharide transport system permease protein